MGERRFSRERDDATGIVFVFSYDSTDPTMLHIFARHTTLPHEAMDTFFEGDTRWNAERRRFETSTDTHTVYWFWIEQDTVVMVVSCFRR